MTRAIGLLVALSCGILAHAQQSPMTRAERAAKISECAKLLPPPGAAFDPAAHAAFMKCIQPALASTATSTGTALAQEPPDAYLTPTEVAAALAGSGKDQRVTFQGGNVEVYTTEARLWLQGQAAKKRYEPFAPQKAQTIRGLFIYAGALGAGPQSAATRIVLVSDKDGTVVAQPLRSAPQEYSGLGALGIGLTWHSLLALFAQKDVERVRAAAHHGEFYIALFYGDGFKRLYQVKEKYLRKLNLADRQP
jgi:hypothetical protein